MTMDCEEEFFPGRILGESWGIRAAKGHFTWESRSLEGSQEGLAEPFSYCSLLCRKEKCLPALLHPSW